jgi:hypothetical protein
MHKSRYFKDMSLEGNEVRAMNRSLLNSEISEIRQEAVIGRSCPTVNLRDGLVRFKGMRKHV